MHSMGSTYSISDSCPNLRRDSVLSPGHVRNTFFVERPSSRMTRVKALRDSLMNSVLKLDLNDTISLQTEICEAALLCHHFIETKQIEKLKKLLSILLEIGERRIRHQLYGLNGRRSSMYINVQEPHKALSPKVLSPTLSRASITFNGFKTMASKRRVFSPSRSTIDDDASKVPTENPSDFRKMVMDYPLSNGNTLLFYTVCNEMIDIMIDLICADSDVNHRSGIGSTPLVTAISIPNNMESIIVLIAAGAVLSDIDFDKIKTFKHISNQMLNLLKCVTFVGVGDGHHPVDGSDVVSNRRGSMIPKTPENRRGSAPIGHEHQGTPQSSYKRRRGSVASSVGAGWMALVSESELLGKIGYKRIQNIQKRNLYDRLHGAKRLAADLIQSDLDEIGNETNQWNKLLYDVMEFGKNDYHQQKSMKRNVRTNESLETTETVSEDEEDSGSTELLLEETKSKLSKIGDAILFPRLRLYEMCDVPTQQRFEAGFGTEREQKGVRIITNTFRRLKFIQNAEEAAEEARRKIRFYSM